MRIRFPTREGGVLSVVSKGPTEHVDAAPGAGRRTEGSGAVSVAEG